MNKRIVEYENSIDSLQQQVSEAKYKVIEVYKY